MIDSHSERSRGRRLASFIVPIAFAIYLVISIVLGDRDLVTVAR